MSRIAQCAIFVFCILGCSLVMGQDKPCYADAMNACRPSNSTGITCSGATATLKCYQDILTNEDCKVDGQAKSMIEEAAQEMTMTVQGLCQPDQSNGTNPSSTCDINAVMTCTKTFQSVVSGMGANQTGSSQPSQAVCRAFNEVVKCIGDVVDKCEVPMLKAQGEAMRDDYHKNMTDMKCCDEMAIKKCMPVEYKITNETADENNCKMLLKDKPCVDKELNKCKDADTKKMYETTIATQIEICENKGYPGSSTALQPAVVLLVVSCMAFLTTLF